MNAVNDINQENIAAPGQNDVNQLCQEIFDHTIGKNVYQHADATKWNVQIVEAITKALVEFNRPFKYCTSCIIMQAGLNGGLNIASTSYWDKSNDIQYSFRWESKSVVGVCHIFAVNYSP